MFLAAASITYYRSNRKVVDNRFYFAFIPSGFSQNLLVRDVGYFAASGKRSSICIAHIPKTSITMSEE